MANLSQLKRKRMMEFIGELREEHKEDDSALAALGEIETELNAKKYGLVWEEHIENVDVQMQENIPVFSEVNEREINGSDSADYNFLLEGDNLHSLYLLEKTHKGKIDIIYIDPPYNTGNKDFMYDDAYVDSNDGFKHSKWLSSFSKRLDLAYRLLSNDGVLFISIDEREVACCTQLCKDRFERVELNVWAKESEKNSGKLKRTKHFRDVHEFIIVCYKNYDVQFGKIAQPLEDAKFQTTNLAKNNANKKGDESRIFKITNPENGMSWEDEWKYDKEEIDRLLTEKLIWFGKKGTNKPRQILPTDERREVYCESIITQGSSSAGRTDLEAIFGLSVFDNPKPVRLIKTLIQISSKKDSIVLDYFAGSGTTGQAVLELNKEDGGNRKFILCTNNENNICENITYQRLKTVITGKRQDGSDYSDGIPANLKYYKTDFVAKNEEFLSDALLDHIKEMVQLEHGVKVDGTKHIIVMTEEELDELEQNWSDCSEAEALYVSRNVLLSTEQNSTFKDVAVYVIPDYYFNFELKEVGLSW